jgi:hypothetical protein
MTNATLGLIQHENLTKEATEVIVQANALIEGKVLPRLLINLMGPAATCSDVAAAARRRLGIAIVAIRGGIIWRATNTLQADKQQGHENLSDVRCHGV